MDIVINGILYGLILALLVGPVFFTIIQTSIERGFASGVFVAIGVSTSDAFYITLTNLGIYQFFGDHQFSKYLAYFGGGVLLILGFYYLIIKSRKLVHFDPEKIQTRAPFRLMMKGFFINGLNPMVLIFWIATAGVATSQFGYTKPGEAIPFFVAIVGTVFFTDILKAKLADKLRMVLTPKFIRIMNITLGIAFIIFGGRLILNAETFQIL